MNETHKKQLIGTLLAGISVLFLISYFSAEHSLLNSMVAFLYKYIGVGVLLIAYFFWISGYRIFFSKEDISVDQFKLTLEVLAWIVFTNSFLIFSHIYFNAGSLGEDIYTAFSYVFGKSGTMWFSVVLLIFSFIITFKIDLVILSKFIIRKSSVLKDVAVDIYKNVEHRRQLNMEQKRLLLNDSSLENKEENKSESKDLVKKEEESNKKNDDSLDNISIEGMGFNQAGEKEKESREKNSTKKDKKTAKKEKKEEVEDAEIITEEDEADTKVVQAEIVEDNQSDIDTENIEETNIETENDSKNKNISTKSENLSDEKKEQDDDDDFDRKMEEYNKLKSKFQKNESEERADKKQLDFDDIEIEYDNVQEEEIVKKEKKPIVLPDIDLLDNVVVKQTVSQEELKAKAKKLVDTLESFKIGATILKMTIGPSITRFELKLAAGIKVSKLLGVHNDIAVALATKNIRIQAPIPGKSAIGIEIPNAQPMLVPFREIVSKVKQEEHPLSVGLGKDINGESVLFNIAKTPHMLVAGATGSGKSVCVNTIICSILFNADPSMVKFIMVDPKMVELSMYNGIPHLLIPVITEPKAASAALNWTVEEMERRYAMCAEHRVKKIEEFNDKMDRLAEEKPKHKEKWQEMKFPYIVAIIDELADLMVVAKAEVEESIMRIAQKARAVGIHLIIATQRPSVNVITGVIKANLPTRVSFAVQSVTDSRTILDQKGGESLIGKGDMLFWPIGKNSPERVQGAFVSNDECERLVKYWVDNYEPEYDENVKANIEAKLASENSENTPSGEVDTSDELFPKAVEIVVVGGKASISLLQRKLSVGHARAARLMDIMEDAGIVSQMNNRNKRDILITEDEIENYIN